MKNYKSYILLLLVLFIFSCDKNNIELTCCDFEISYEKEYGIESNWSSVGIYNQRSRKEECAEGGWITFKEDGTFEGSSSCNGMGGKYEISGSNNIILSDYSQTLRLCVGNESEYWEGKFLGELLKSDWFEIEGNKLIMHTSGQTKLVFIAFEDL